MEPEAVPSRKTIERTCIVVLLLIVITLLVFTIFLYTNDRPDGNLRAKQTADAIYATNTAVQYLINATETARAITGVPRSP